MESGHSEKELCINFLGVFFKIYHCHKVSYFDFLKKTKPQKMDLGNEKKNPLRAVNRSKNPSGLACNFFHWWSQVFRWPREPSMGHV